MTTVTDMTETANGYLSLCSDGSVVVEDTDGSLEVIRPDEVAAIVRLVRKRRERVRHA